MQITWHSEGKTHQKTVDDIPELLNSDEGVVWVELPDPGDAEIRVMEDIFRFHPLAIEDTRNQEQRPKAEDFPDHLFIILNPMFPETEDIFRELDVFIGPNYIVTVHRGCGSVIKEAQQRLDPARQRQAVNSSYLFYMIMDTVVDGYFPEVVAISDEIDNLGDRILLDAQDEMIDRLFELKHRLNTIWKSLVPQRNIINVLTEHDTFFRSQNNLYHLRDVSDHLYQISDSVSFYRDTINSLVGLYATAVSNRLNEVVTRLTVFTIIIGVLTVISGFYGMNFIQLWPPLDDPNSGLYVFGGMIVLVVMLLLYFRRQRWF